MSVAERYARDVLDGKVVVGEFVKKAAKRFLSDLERDDIYFDEAEAAKFVNFAQNRCRLWEDKWRGEPVHLEPWMMFIFEQIFGWIKRKDGLRRIRKVYVQVAKKNAKSTLSGVLANFHLFADQRVMTPKVFVGANNEDQAKISVNIAGKIIEQSPDLYGYVEDEEVSIFQYKENIINIVHRKRDGFIKALAKEPEGKQSKQSGGKHGLNPSLGIIDEYGMADSAELLDTLKTAQAARMEPLMFVITTAGHKQNGPCFQQLRRTGIEVLEGTIEDDSYLAFIYEMDKGDSIYDEKVWPKSNPNLGVSVFEEFLRDQVREAKNEGGSKEVNIRTLNFNEWCETPEVWIPKDTWLRNAKGADVSVLDGMFCFGGLQLIAPREMNAFSFVFPYVTKETHAVKVLFFMAEKAVIDNQSKMDFGRWTEEGWIKTCPGNVLDNDFIFDCIVEELRKYNMHSFGYPINAEKSDVVQALVKAGVEANPVSQGYKSNSEPTFSWEGMLNAGIMEHFNNPVLTWTNSQCMAVRKGDDIKIERAGGRTAGIVACVNALAQWKAVEAEEKKEFAIGTVSI